MRAKCSISACTSMSTARGLCGKHYATARKYGRLPSEWSREKRSLWKTDEQRLLEKVYKNPVTGCWLWQASTDAMGYGQTCTRGASGAFRAKRAHVLAWEVWNGEKPPHALIRHKCDNKRCINPEHLELGTHKDNSADIALRGRRRGYCNGEKNGRALLSQGQANEIRERYYTERCSQEHIANEYGVSQFAVSMIVRNKRYMIDDDEFAELLIRTGYRQPQRADRPIADGSSAQLTLL